MSEKSSSGDDKITGEQERNRTELFDLYKMAVETDRYELDLGWKISPILYSIE